WVSCAPVQVPSGELDASPPQPAASRASRQVVSRAIILRPVGICWSLSSGVPPAPGSSPPSWLRTGRPQEALCALVCSLPAQMPAEPSVSLCARGVHSGDGGGLALIGVFGPHCIERGHRGGVPDM